MLLYRPGLYSGNTDLNINSKFVVRRVCYTRNMKNRNKSAVKIYDSVALDYVKNFSEMSTEELEFRNAFLKRLKRGAHIVDLGCGAGDASNYFVEHGMESEGVDLSKAMIGIAKENYPDIHFTIADIRKFMPTQKANAVWASYSLFHFEQSEFEKTLLQIKKYLKNEGLFALIVQEGEGEVEVAEPLRPEEKIFIRLYTEKELKAILSKHDFEVLDIKRKLPNSEKEYPFNKLMLLSILKKSS